MQVPSGGNTPKVKSRISAGPHCSLANRRTEARTKRALDLTRSISNCDIVLDTYTRRRKRLQRELRELFNYPTSLSLYRLKVAIVEGCEPRIIACLQKGDLAALSCTAQFFKEFIC